MGRGADGQRAGRVLGAGGVPAAVGGGVEGVEGAQARARRAVVDGGVHAAPRVQRRDRGVAAEREGDAGVGQESANGLVAERPLDAQPLGVHAGVAAPGRVEGRLHAGDHPQVAHPLDVGAVDHLHVLEPVPAGPDGGRAELGDHGLDGVEHLGDGGVADARGSRPGCRRSVQARTWCDELRRSRSAGRRRCPAGRCRAAAQRRGVRAEGAVAEQVSPGAGQAQLADDVEPAALGQLAPVAEHPRPGLLGARAPSRPARSSAPETSGPAISCTLPMPSAAAASRVARCAARRWSAPTAP